MKIVWVVLSVLALAISACQTASPAESAGAEPAAATTAADPNATVALLAFRSNICCTGTKIVPGQYLLPDWLNIPLTLRVDQEGWKHFNEEAGEFFGIVKGNSNSLGIFSEAIYIFPAYEPLRASQFFQAFTNAAEFEVVAEPSDTTIAGYPARQVDLIAKPSNFAENAGEDIPAGVQPLSAALKFSPTGLYWSTQSPEAHARVLKVDMGETSIIIYLESPQADFDRFIVEALAIVETLSPNP